MQPLRDEQRMRKWNRMGTGNYALALASLPSVRSGLAGLYHEPWAILPGLE